MKSCFPTGTAGRPTARALLRLIAIGVLVSRVGCSYSMLSEGRLREDAFTSVLDRTVAARGIGLDGPVDARPVTQAELTGILQDALDAEFPEGELEDYERALTTVGLWPPDTRLRDVFLEVMTQEVAGLYVPADAALYVVTDVDLPVTLRVASALLMRDLMMELSLAHEVVHLLQHRRYPELFDPDTALDRQDDLGNAVQAALEGDATRYGFEALGVPVGSVTPSSLREQVDRELSPDDGALAEAPLLLRLTLGFPYIEGYAMSFAEGRNLLEDPPASTEQVMHPDRRHQAFTMLDLPEADLPTGCRVVHENTFGELYTSVLFRDLGADLDPPLYPEVWEGWDGDRYLVAACGDRFELVWVTLWDSPEDAEDFAIGYRRIAERVAARAGFADMPAIRSRGSEAIVVSQGLATSVEILTANSRRARVSRRSEAHAVALDFALSASPPTGKARNAVRSGPFGELRAGCFYGQAVKSRYAALDGPGTPAPNCARKIRKSLPATMPSPE